MSKAVLCDTCILIDFVNGRSEQIAQLHANTIQLFINPVIELELLQGARNKAELLRLEKIAVMFYNVEMSVEVVDVARQLIKFYSLSHSLRLADALIAVAALVYDLDLLTYNLKYFRFISISKVTPVFRRVDFILSHKSMSMMMIFGKVKEWVTDTLATRYS